MRVEPKKAEEWEDVDAAVFKNTIKTRDRPAILRGLVRAWPATQAGLESAHSLTAYLKTFDSGHAAPLFEGPASIKGRFFYNDTLDGFNFESKRALLGDVLELLCRELKNESAPALYSGSVSLPIHFPGVSNRNPRPHPDYRRVGARVDLDRKPHLHRGAFRPYRKPGLCRGRAAPLHHVSAGPDQKSLRGPARSDPGGSAHHSGRYSQSGPRTFPPLCRGGESRRSR